MHPVLKVVDDKGCRSYVLACPRTRAALLVDPKAGRRDTYRDVLDKYGLRLAKVVDTHTHADHLSDSVALVGDGAELFMSRRTPGRRKLTRVGDGDRIALGDLSFEVREVPGHTADSIALVGHGLVLCGDTLFAGGLARTDFRGSDAAELFGSVTARLLTLPDETLVFPGHDYRDLLFTTIGHERRDNPALRHRDAAAYAAAVRDVPGAGNTPDVDAMLATNLEGEPDLSGAGGAAAACCAGDAAATPIARPREATARELAPRRGELVAKGEWLDVRDPWEYREEHVLGARSVPLGELGFHLDGLRAKDELVLQCLGGVRSLTAARTLAYLGVARDPVSLQGGFRAWKQEGFETVQGKQSPGT
jgi:glyoxylase-like metal-dependent hydrolase (beta-lactamase superfamily II)/rhodanese-related sulfurtransferase